VSGCGNRRIWALNDGPEYGQELRRPARSAAALATVQPFATDVMKPSIFGKRVRKLKATSRALSSANLDASA
jgi:hypothetical protein